MNKTNIKKRLLRTMLITALSIEAISTYSEEIYAQDMISYENSYNDLNINNPSLYNYCNIYNLNYNKVYSILSKYSLSSTNINGIQYETSEEAILTFVNDLYFNPKKYNTNKEDIVNRNSKYEMINSLENNIYKYSNILNIDSEMALAISYAECGTPANSHNYLVNNNPAGLGPNMKFDNKEIGIIYYCILLKNKYKLGEKANDEFINKVAHIYAENPSHWINLTTGIYNNIHNNYYYYNSQAKTNTNKVLTKNMI